MERCLVGRCGNDNNVRSSQYEISNDIDPDDVVVAVPLSFTMCGF